MYSSTKSEMLSADGQVPIRLVTIHGVPCWQASTGRTFPVIAGAEDPPSDPKSGDDGKPPESKKGEGEGSGDEGDFDKDRALATIKKLRDQEKAQKVQLKELETLKADQKKRDDAEKSEADRLKEQIAEAERKATAAEQKLTESQNRSAIERAATKAGAADPEDVFRLLKSDEFEHDESGKLTNAEDLVKALLKAKPYLAGKAGSGSGVPGTPRSNGTQSHEDRVKENQEKLKASGLYAPLG